ncbi:MAG: zinc ribbon domain-containing protein [Acidobacteria bacterium]|nr:MAG: zinc ribbon domain-containing protein [Acidobacteriota bacterium]
MHKKFFATLFVIYLACLAGLWGFLIYAYNAMWIITAPHDRNALAFGMVLFAAAIGLFMVFLLIGIGRFVYSDAKARRMEPVVWTLVAVFVPYFIGLIAYLIVRKPLAENCGMCGQPVLETQAFCPYCGNQVRVQCPNCQAVAQTNFTFCPKCGTRLPAAETQA